MFPVHTTPEKCENLTIISHLFEETNVQENHVIIVMSAFWKSSVFMKCFPCDIDNHKILGKAI